MKKQILKLVSFTAMLAVAVMPLTSCSDDDGGSNNPSWDTVETDETLSGTISADLTLDSETIYLIDGPVTVTNGATLTIPAGMTIYAEPKFSAYILVLQGGKMVVEGTASAPVIFTVNNNNPDARWGGLVVNGYAPISGATTGTTSTTEISSMYPYGGTDSADNSGSYEYMVLDRTGARSSADVEHNGLTLNAVGSSTVIENICITNSSDDGVEFFGGCVNVTNLLVVDSDDDMFDFTQGYKGTLTNAYGIWTSSFTSSEGDPSGVEADGNLDGNGSTHVAQSDFNIVNMTIENNAANQKMLDAIMIRRGATATITNALITGTSTKTEDIVDTTNSKSNANTATSISVTYTVSYTGNELTATDTYSGISFNPSTANTGADKTAFSWVPSEYAAL